jgi:sentrin-specific protease 7
MFVVNPLAVCEELCGIAPEKSGYLIYFDSLLMLDQRIGI